MLVETIAKNLNVSIESVEFLGVENVIAENSSSSSSRSRSSRSSSGSNKKVEATSASSVRVRYAVRASIQSIGAGFQDATEASDFLTAALDDSIANGNFGNDFQALAVEKQVAVLQGVTTTAVTVESIEVTNDSPPPSVFPSLAPSLFVKSKSGNDNDTLLGMSTLAVIAIGAAIVVLVAVAAAVLSVHKSKSNASPNGEKHTIAGELLESGLGDRKREDYASVEKNVASGVGDGQHHQSTVVDAQLLTTGHAEGNEYRAVILGCEEEEEEEVTLPHHQVVTTAGNEFASSVTLGYDEDDDDEDEEDGALTLTKAEEQEDAARI